MGREPAMIDKVELLVDALRRAFPAGPPRKDDGGGWQNPALDVLDCVLSLNRNYDRFCLPRVTVFRDRHPEITSLRNLRELIASYPTPLDFSIVELDYQDVRRAATLVGVIDFLIREQIRFGGASESECLLQWAKSVTPSDYLTVRVPGFGLSGFQYLRILLGVQTLKPDIYIQRFVSSAVGWKVDDVEALMLSEEAGQRLGWPLADLDYAVWEGGARGSTPAPETPRLYSDPFSTRGRCRMNDKFRMPDFVAHLTEANPMNSRPVNQYTVYCDGEVVLESAKWSAAERAAKALMVAKGCSRSGIRVLGTYVGSDKNYSAYVGVEVDWMAVRSSLGISTPQPTVELLQHAVSLLHGKAALGNLCNDASNNLRKGILRSGKIYSEHSDDEAGSSVDAYQGGLPGLGKR
jgi:hypothetical protein